MTVTLRRKELPVPGRLDLNDTHFRLAKERGITVAVSTGSHSVYHLENIHFGMHIAKRA